MKKWFVEIPITGTIGFEVSAPDEAGAFDEAWRKFNDGETENNLVWEAIEVVVEGNVTHAMLNQQSARELK